MMHLRRIPLLLMALLFVVIGSKTFAQWPTDPSVNLVLANGAGEQTTPIVRPTSDGGCFVLFYSNASGNYDVYLQYLDYAGEVQWGNGLLISNNPMTSFITVWDFEVDINDNAIIATNDIRNGGDWDIYGYSISTDGTFNWGEDGIVLSANDGGDVGQHIQPTSDGGVVFAWQEETETYGVVTLRKVDAEGNDAWDPPTITLSSEYTVDRGKMAPTSDGGVIVGYLVHTGSSWLSPSNYYAQRYSADGEALWDANGVGVNTLGGISGFSHPDLVSDGDDGAVFFWYDSHVDNQLHAFVQRVSSAGTVLWGGGTPVRASISEGQIEMTPTLAYNPDSESTYLFYTISNTAQSMWGIGAQRFNASGERQWSDSGETLVALATQQPSHLSGTIQPDGGAVVAFLQDAGGMNDFTEAIKVDADGNQVWETSPTILSSVASEKGHHGSTVNAFGQVLSVFTDSRAGNPDLYLQNVNPDGSLGAWSGPGPALVIDWPADGEIINALPFSLNYTVTGFEVAEEGGDGLISVTVTGSSSGDQFNTAQTSVVIEALEVGINTITLELVDYEGSSLVPAVIAEVNVNYVLPTLTILSPEDGVEVTEQTIVVQFAITNFELGAEEDGYLAMSVNENATEYFTVLDPLSIQLEEGENTIALELVDTDQQSLDPAVTASVNVTYVVNSVGEGNLSPVEYALHEAWPNPFNPSTTVQYSMKATGHLHLAVYDILGREVALLVDGVRPAGVHSLSWNAEGLPSGLYFLRMTAGSGYVATKKLVRMK